MSVLVKGMEMPLYATRNGEKDTIYQCAVVVHKDNTAELVVRRESAYPFANCNEAHIDKYPLIEVQTPHGTLIDKEVAIETFKEVYCGHCKKEIPCFVCSVPIALDVLNDIPTIIEAEVSEE